MKPYLDSDKTKVAPPSATDEQPHDTEKVDPPSLADKQILDEERIDNYAINNLPNEIVKMILVDIDDTETYAILSHTCSRFNDIIKRKKNVSLLHIHISSGK